MCSIKHNQFLVATLFVIVLATSVYLNVRLIKDVLKTLCYGLSVATLRRYGARIFLLYKNEKIQFFHSVRIEWGLFSLVYITQ